MISTKIKKHNFIPNKKINVTLNRISSYYNGPIARVRRFSDNEEMDIYDMGTLSHFLFYNEINNNKIGSIVKWYDQSGRGNDVQYTTASNQPIIYTN